MNNDGWRIDRRGLPWQLLMIFFALVIGIGVSGYFFYRSHEERFRGSIEREISAIADLKRTEIQHWRKERLEDARLIQEDALVISRIHEWLHGGRAPVLERDIRAWLNSLQKSDEYKTVLLLDTIGSVVLASDAKEPLGDYARTLGIKALKTGEISFSGLHQGETEEGVHFDVLVPLFLSGGNGRTPVAILLVRIDPFAYLFPLIRTWPTPSRTAESLLVLREGEHVVFLNELRHMKQKPLSLRIPVSRTDLPATMAVLGRQGVVEGNDYRGVPVVAALRDVSGFSWYLVAKVDAAEVFAPMRRYAWIILLVTISLILAAATGTGLLWRQQRILFYKSELEIRRRSEERLANEKGFSDSVINSLPGIFYLFEQDGRLIRWNRNFELVSGYSAEELSGMNPLDFFAPEERNLVAVKMQEVYSVGAAIVEANFLSRDGRKTPYHFSGLLFATEDHKYLAGTGLDMTVRKRAEDQLRASEAELHDSYFAQAAINMILGTSFENIPFEGFLQKALNMILSVPWIAFEATGSIFLVEGKEDLLVMKAQLNIPRELQELCAQLPYGKCLCGRAAVERAIQFAGHVDEWHDIRFEGMQDHGHYAVPILFRERVLGVINIYLSAGHTRKAQDGEFLRAVADALATIIVRKQAEAELDRYREHLESLVKVRSEELVVAKERLQFLLASAPAVIYSCKVSGDYGITFVSDNIAVQFGYSPDELLGAPGFLSDRIHPEDAARVITQRKTLSERGCQVSEYRVRNKEGAYQWTHDEQRLVRDAEGNPAEIVGFLIDITDRRDAEEAVKELNNKLENSLREVQAANKELEAFSYSVSHDLRAPIRHIAGFVELLRQNTPHLLDEKSTRYLNIISDATTQMEHLIDDILAFSRMGRTEMRKREVDLDYLVREAMEELRPAMQGRKITWDIGSLPTGWGDSSMLRLVWINLLGNALKFTGTKPEAEIEVGYRDEKGEYLFYVKDNGVGFDMAYVNKLFDLFQRLHRKEEFEGTGVGLANVRRIIHRHGGRTWAEAKPGEGATFFFTLPKISSDDGKEKEMQRPGSAD